MSSNNGTKGQRRKVLQNELTRGKISLGPIVVDEFRYKRGIRVSTSREFRFENGEIVPNTGFAQAILHERKMDEMHQDMILQAERCLTARGEETLAEFQQRTAEKNNLSEDPFAISIRSVN